MELRWPGAYGPAMKRRRSDGGAMPCSKRLAVVLGSTGIVHAAPIYAPRGYAISRRPLPPWPEALSPGVSRGQFDDADHEVLAMAIVPLADITDVFCIAWHPRPAHAALPPGLCRGRFNLVADALVPFTDITHVAWEPRPTHAAPRGANHTTMLCNVPNCSKRFQLLVLDPFHEIADVSVPGSKDYAMVQGDSDLGPILRQTYASNRSDEKQQLKAILENVGSSMCRDHCDWFGNSGLEALSRNADRLLVVHFLQEMFHLVKQKNFPAAFRCYWNNKKFDSLSTDYLYYKMLIHGHSDSAFGHYQQEMRKNQELWPLYISFLVEVNMFKGNNKMPAELSEDGNTSLKNVGGALDSISSTKDGLADEDSNLMVKLKFLTYKIIDTFVPDPFNQEASHVENIPDPPYRIVKNPDHTCLSGRLWCQTQCLTLLVFLFVLIPTVNADAGMMCPVRSMNDFLPKTTCPVIKLKGSHWSHSKFAWGENEENRPAEHPDSTQYFLETNFTRCTVLQDLLFVLGAAALCRVLWELNQQKQVRILSFNRSVIFLWIDTLLASIVYYACWSIYGSLLSLSKPKEPHYGLHMQYINLAGCSIYALLLLFLIGRHGMAWRSIVYRLVALFCLLLPPFILWHMEPNSDNIFRIGVLGFCATVVMYVFKWFTIVGFKGPTTMLNVAAILLFLCCGFPDTTSLYGCAQIGSFGFRFIDIVWSVLVMSPTEWASMRASIQGKWRFVAVTAKRMMAATKRNLRPRGARDGCALPFVR